MKIPFRRFEGRLRQLHVSDLPEVFDVFFPRFRTEHELSSFVTRGRGRVLVGPVALADDSAAFIGRGRERRFSGGSSLPRQKYHCLEDAVSNRPSNNTLLCELFAYAEPMLPVMLELLDSTVDREMAERICDQYGWDFDVPCILHLIKERDVLWLLPPSMGIPKSGACLRYPISLSHQAIESCVDLRVPGERPATPS